MAISITVLGTMSNVGKSVIAAGLCRIFRQDGHSVAPFKSQNMALNSFITREGLEIGRAQAMQAEAAGIEPTSDMNPILLKPTDDTGSQVIVNGEVWAQMGAQEYTRIKGELFPKVMASYDRLAASHDIIVIEGAGGAAEINLLKDDFVNTGMARAARSPALLVGDIDRGGVFAQIYGTIALLGDDDRSVIKGCVVNKFRGDPAILEPGLRRLEELSGVPVLGVAPYRTFDLDDEDSLSDRFARREVDAVDIAVVRLPRISNYTDFGAFERVSGVSLRYVSSPREMGSPDMVILPGTKNTLADLKWLRESGMETMIKRRAAAGSVIFGVCGGYQMLGRTISDPHGVEGGGRADGLGLLPTDTVFSDRKTRTRTSGRICALCGTLAPLSGMEMFGYEIHMGRTERGECGAVAELTDEISGAASTDGAQSGDVYGSYVHGFFDADGVADAVCRALADRKGVSLDASDETSYAEHKEREYDALAAMLRSSLDMERIYEMMRAGL